MNPDERDTARPKPAPLRVPVGKMALKAPKVPGGAGPPPETEFQRRAMATPAAQPLPSLEGIASVDPAPSVDPTTGRSPLAAVTRWAAPRVLALVASAIGGGVAAPRITGNVGRVEAHDVELAQSQAELRALRTRIATLETERATDQEIANKQAAFMIKLWRDRGNTEIRIQDKNFPPLPSLEIQAPTDTRKPAQVATPFPTE